MESKSKNIKLAFLAAMCFSMFLVYGIYANSFGVSANLMMAYFNISEAKLGLITTVQAIGAVAVTVFLGLIGEKFNKINGLAFGCILMGAASLIIGLIPKLIPSGSGYNALLLFSVISGLGYMFIDLLMNGVISDVFPEKKSSLLPYVHAFYGGGAMLAPIIVSSLVNTALPESFSKPFFVLGITSIAVFLIFIFIAKMSKQYTPYMDMTEMRARATANPAEIFVEKKAWLLVLACFLLIAFQNSIGLWLTTLCENEYGYSYNDSAFAVSLYYGGILAMRFLSPLIYKKISGIKYFTVFMLTAVALFIVFLFLDVQMIGKYILITLVGLAVGGGCPTIIIICCDTFPQRSASASSLFASGICLSTFITPVLTGKLIEIYGFTVPMLLISLFLVCSVITLQIVQK